MRKWTSSIFAVILFLVIDQYTKFLAVMHLKEQKPAELIKGVFELRYLENRGAAFGSLQGKQTFLLLITGVVLMLLVYVYRKIPEGKRYVPLSFTLILLFSGAVGNMIDRVHQGYVVDFLYFKLIDFPIFNIADCYVTVSAVLLVILILFVYEEEELGFLGDQAE